MITKTTLENGIRVITEEIPSVHSVSVGIWVPAGSRDETWEENGISHFIEHMLFKGTKRRSARQIAMEIDSVGGVLNAFTSKEFSSFYAKVLAEHLPIALDLLFDIYLNSTFAPQEMKKERQVIAQEINMVEDTPDEYVHDLFNESLWPRHPLGFPILGRLESIEGLSRTRIREYFQEKYLQIQPLWVAAGKLKHEDLLKPVQEVFAKNPLRPRGNHGRPPKAHPRVLVKNKPLEQVHLVLGAPGCSAVHPRRYVFSVLNTLWGGGMSSRLFQEVRERRGLVYSIYSFLSSFTDSGMIGVYAGTGENTLSSVLKIIRREMKKLAEDPVKPKELRSAKEQLKGNLLLSLESTDSRMSRLAKSEIYFQRFVSTEEIIEGIERVSAEEVAELAGQIFRKNSQSLTVLGPVTEKELPREVLEA